MKLVTSLFAGLCCLTLGACQQMPNNPSAIAPNSASIQASSGFEVSQAAFGGGFASAPIASAPITVPAPITSAPITVPAPITTAPVVTTLPPVSVIRTPINNTAPIAAAPLPAAAPFATAPLAAAPLPAAPLAATAPITTAPIITTPSAASSQNAEPVPPLPVAPPVGPGSDIPAPGIGFGYTNTYSSTLED